MEYKSQFICMVVTHGHHTFKEDTSGHQKHPWFKHRTIYIYIYIYFVWWTNCWFQMSLSLFLLSDLVLPCRFCATSAFLRIRFSAGLTLPSRSHVLHLTAADVNINSKCPDLCQHFSSFSAFSQGCSFTI